MTEYSTIELVNDFHGSSASVRVLQVYNPTEVLIALTPAQVHRVNRKLCAVADCCCGEGRLRIRGPQRFLGKVAQYEKPDGSVVLTAELRESAV